MKMETGITVAPKGGVGVTIVEENRSGKTRFGEGRLQFNLAILDRLGVDVCPQLRVLYDINIIRPGNRLNDGGCYTRGGKVSPETYEYDKIVFINIEVNS